MRWVEVVALLTVVVIVALPPRAAARVGALARGGRLGARDRTGPVRTIDPIGLLARVSPRSAGLALGLGCLALGVLVTPVAGVDAAVVSGTATLLLRDARSARRATGRLAEIRAMVGLLEAELQAGSPPPSALAAVAAGSPRLAAALDAPAPAGARAATGAPVPSSGSPSAPATVRWDAAAALVACPDPDLQRLGVAWRVGESTGVPIADVLGRLAADLRALADQHRAVAVALAGPRSSAVLLCLLPVLGIALGAAMGARPLALLIDSSSGRLLGCAGLLLDAAGVFWVRRILQRAARP